MPLAELAGALLLAGFLLLAIQAISEIIKRIAVMRGVIPDEHEAQSAHHVAEEIGLGDEVGANPGERS